MTDEHGPPGERRHHVVEVDGAVELAIQADGKLVVAGLAENGLPTEFALVRVHP